MRISGRRRRVAFFIALGACLAALALAFNIGWIVLSWREGALLLLGILLFPLIIAGLVLNTIFLVREIRRNEQHNAFINAVTHELKTPVASIRLYLETLLARGVEPDQRREFYRVMLADSDRLLATVEQILRAGKAGQAQRWIHRQPVDMRELALECIGLISNRYHLPPGAIEFAAAPEALPAVVTGDAEELRAALSNLLDNAIKYSAAPAAPGDPPPAPAARVEIARDDPKYLTIRVRDQGPGIPRGELKSIFKRFYRIPGMAGGVKGTGLGLFIVRSVVRRHGGRVRAESEGRGSTFVVQLPPAAPRFSGGPQA